MLRLCIPLLLCASCAPCRAAEAPSFDVDALPHTSITLPNGTKAVVIRYADNNWRFVEVDILKSLFEHDEDICFEAKYDAPTGADKLRIFGVQMPPGRDPVVYVDQKIKKQAIAEFKQNDNLFLCGTLRRARDGKGVEFQVVHAKKLLDDEKRYFARIQTLEKAADGEALVDLGHQIQAQVTGAQVFGTFKALEGLRDKAYDGGLVLKERNVKAGDADALFAIAVQWKELRGKRQKFRDLVQKALQIDPDHPKAGRVAQDELGMIKFRGRWMYQSEREKALQEEELEKQRKTDETLAIQSKRKDEVQEAVNKRADLINGLMSDLRSADAAGRQRALESIGKRVQSSPDPGFGEQAVDILVNLNDVAAISPGLELAGKSEHPEVRQRVFEALAWRIKEPKAREIFVSTLKNEKDGASAKAAIEAVIAAGGKTVAAILIDGLAAADKHTQDEVIEGLKGVTNQQLNTKEAWEEWWSKNKTTLN